MRKRYFFLMMLLFPIATMFTVGNAYAEDPPKEEYDAAMEAIDQQLIEIDNALSELNGTLDNRMGNEIMLEIKDII